MTIHPQDISIPQMHQYLLGSVGPRPICFASTLDAAGNRNLSPFSFFNVFSANPPILIFSPARSGRTLEQKDTYHNVKEVPEVVINVVTYDMVQQMSLTSSPFPPDVDEFVKAGFTPLASEKVRPFRVAESPIQMECKVLEVNELGEGGAAGNLVICEVVAMHISDDLMDSEGRIDQTRIDLVSRMGGNWYCRAHGDALFELNKPLSVASVGVDHLPDAIRNSDKLHGNQLGKLGNMHELPSMEYVEKEIERLGKEKITLSEAYAALDRDEVETAYAILSRILS